MNNITTSTGITRRFVSIAAALCLATLALALAPAPAAASPVDNDIIAMLPKDAGEVAYANLKAARQYPWFEQLK
jgi:hypothetical protein